MSLSSSALTTPAAVEILRSATTSAPNVSVVTQTYDTAEEYYTDFFRTDHHWNILGASKAYNSIAEELGLVPFDPYPTWDIQGVHFRGSNARAGLCPMTEGVFDTSFDFKDVTIVGKDGSATAESTGHPTFYESAHDEQQRIFYDLYYGKRNTSPKELGPGQKKALFISDSYGFALKRPLALNYSILYTESDLHGDSKDDKLTLKSRIESDDVDEIIFVACVANYVGTNKRMPSYFK